jgi:hypothetical protein
MSQLLQKEERRLDRCVIYRVRSFPEVSPKDKGSVFGIEYAML